MAWIPWIICENFVYLFEYCNMNRTCILQHTFLLFLNSLILTCFFCQIQINVWAALTSGPRTYVCAWTICKSNLVTQVVSRVHQDLHRPHNAFHNLLHHLHFTNSFPSGFFVCNKSFIWGSEFSFIGESCCFRQFGVWLTWFGNQDDFIEGRKWPNSWQWRARTPQQHHL